MTDRNKLRWRTSTRSSGGACVEIATDGESVHIRHSKDPDGPVITIDREVFQDFIAYVTEADAPRT